MANLPDAVTSLVLRDEREQPVTLGSLKPAVMVWLRHFGCLFCREQASEFATRLSEIEAQGSRLVFIGTGNPYFAKVFREDYLSKHPSILVLCDPECKSYRALGLRRTWLTMFKLSTWKRAWAARKAGFRQSFRPQGDSRQHGGIVVVDGTGGVRYRFVSDEAGHHPGPQEVVDALGVELLL